MGRTFFAKGLAAVAVALGLSFASLARAQTAAAPALVTESVRLTSMWNSTAESDATGRMPFQVFVRTGPTTRDVLHEGRTAPDGTARFDLRFPEAARAKLLVCPVEPGLQAKAAPLRPAQDGDDVALVARLRVAPGLTLAGCLVDESGKPVPGLISTSPFNDESRWHRGRSTRKDGGFELHLAPQRLAELRAEGGGRIRVYAHSSEVGGGSAREPLSEASEAAEPIVVPLRPGGVIGGTIVDKEGVPIPAVEVEIRLSGERAVPDGRSLLTAVTDGNGAFRVAGLTPGAFEVNGILGHEWREGFVFGTQHRGRLREPITVSVTDAPVPADGEPRTFTLDAPLLVVELQNADGTPYTGSCSVASPPNHRDRTPAGMPRSPVVHVFTSAEGGRLELTGCWNERGACTFPTRAAAKAELDVFGMTGPDAGFPHRLRSVDLTRDGVTRVTLRAQSPAPRGRLKLGGFVTARKPSLSNGRAPRVKHTAPDANGKTKLLPVPPPALLDPMPIDSLVGSEVTVLDPTTLATVAQISFWFETTIEVPSGSYLLQIDHGRERFGNNGFGGAVVPFEVKIGETTALDLELGPGATLRPIIPRAATAHLYLEDQRGVTFRVRPALDGSDVRASPSASLILPPTIFGPGEPHESLPLPTGTFKLKGTVDGRPVDTMVTLEEGACLDLEL